MDSFVQLERDTTGAVATLLLQRPKVNALNDEVIEQLHDACTTLAGDSSVRAVVVWGGPKVFCGGADIEQFVDYDVAGATALSQRLNAALAALEQLPQVTISAINRYALGGGLELAMATDFRVAAAGALLGLPEAQLGLLPGGGGTQRLPRLIGVTRAKEVIYRGGNLTAEQALEVGLVSEVVDADAVYDRAMELAGEYATAPASVALAKTAIAEGLALPMADALEVEARAFGAAFATEDAATGVRSFIESGPGKATFSGR